MRSVRLLLIVLAVLAHAACADDPHPLEPGPRPGGPSFVLQPNTGYEQVVVGGRFACGLTGAGTVHCWGPSDPFHGELNVPIITDATQLTAGRFHMCALRSNGAVICWGNPIANHEKPDLSDVIQVSSGGNHACALRAGGTVACWGLSSDGQTSVPAGLTDATYVGAGGDFACAVRGDKTVVCWGDTSRWETSPPPGLSNVTQVTLGSQHACALQSGGTAVCWGRNASGALDVPSGLTDVTQIAVQGPVGVNNDIATCALRQGGTVVCWGEGASIPPDVSGVIQIDGQEDAICLLFQDGRIECFGKPNPPERFGPTAGFSASPTAVDPDESFTLSLNNERVLGYSGPVTFTYAFDCGDGTGYAPATATSSTTCVASSGGELTVRGKVIDHDGDSAEYSETVTVTAIEQAIIFTSQPPSPAIIRGSYAPAATGGDSGNPVVFSSLTPDVCTVTGTNATFVDVGTCTLAADQDGGDGYTPAPQVTQSFDIRYGFIGFFRPVKNPPAMNVAKAGQTVVLRWMVVDARGWPVTNLTDVTVSVSVLECGSGGRAGRGEGHFSRTATGKAGKVRSGGRPDRHWAGRSGLKHLGFGFYQFNWKTSKSYAKSCQTMQLDLGDGAPHEAMFRFK